MRCRPNRCKLHRSASGATSGRLGPRDRSGGHVLHHLSLGVRDLGKSARFYDAVLAPLGYIRVWEDFTGSGEGAAVGYGVGGGGDKLALKERRSGNVASGAGFHLAFAAPSRTAIDAFHAAALRHGGKDNGAPGLRPAYGPGYYAAFVIDPDGHRLEAVLIGDR